MNLRRLALIFSLCVAPAACDDDSAPSAEQDAVTDSADTSSAGPCPETSPDAGSACEEEGRVCEYGDDPRAGCRTTATCTGGSYELTSPRCEPLPEVTCPATREEASGQACEPQDAWCTYDEGLACECTNCMDGPVGGCAGDPVWRCEAPNPVEGCPAAMPNLGEACASEDQTCVYRCGEGGARVCSGGGWSGADGGPCPVSTREAKRGIHYLSPEALSRVHEEVVGMKLARYRYADPALGEGPQLGVILEDLPPGSPAADHPRKMINLYGYASMLLAATQEQAKTIEALERRVRALEQRVEALSDQR